MRGFCHQRTQMTSSTRCCRGPVIGIAVATILLAGSLTSPGAARAVRASGEAKVQVQDLGAVTGATPLEACSDSEAFMGSEVEPVMAVDPDDPSRVAIAYQQDRTPGLGSIDAGVSVFDGETVHQAVPDVVSCPGGLNRVGSVRIAAGAHRTMYLATLAHSSDAKEDPPSYPVKTAIVVSVSRDGGLTWEAGGPVSPPLVGHESEPVIRAHPSRPGVAYVAWSRHNPVASGDHVITVAATTDFGENWKTAVLAPPPVHPTRLTAPATEDEPFDVALTPAYYPAALLPMPDGSLRLVSTAVAVEDWILEDSPGRWPVAAVRIDHNPGQDDGGADDELWPRPETWQTLGAVDAKFPREAGGGRKISTVPWASADVDASGNAYVVWPHRGPKDETSVVMTRLLEGSSKWTPPAVVSDGAETPFLTAVAALDDGTVAVSFHDLRNDDDRDGGALTVTPWITLSPARGEPDTWTERAVRSPFDAASGLLLDGDPYVGNVSGLIASNRSFFVSLSLPNDPSTQPTRGATDIQLYRVRLR